MSDQILAKTLADTYDFEVLERLYRHLDACYRVCGGLADEQQRVLEHAMSLKALADYDRLVDEASK